LFSNNLKYYRLKNALSKKELADRVNVTSMTITNYENGDRKPSMDVLKKMSQVLGIRVSDFLAVRNKNIVFCHGEFRKNSTLSIAQQDYVCESVEEYLNRFMTIVEILGGEVLPEAPETHAIILSGDDEQDAFSLRKHLGLALEGPIVDLIGTLENKGILVLESDINNQKFSGMNGLVNDRPYIVFNPTMTCERNRSTIAHELAHLIFIWPAEMESADIEKRATAISGAFLFPKNDAVRELGLRRRAVSADMQLTATEYGISMLMLAKRAEICEIITSTAAKTFFVAASTAGWRSKEPSRIDTEKPQLFEQLVYRAINEGDISKQRGAELLKIPYDEVVKHCCFNEEL
jgi:Zn-dependent peptidase ImmA (M78 family)/transcriptional regulator with XRE-family HTH domain